MDKNKKFEKEKLIRINKISKNRKLNQVVNEFNEITSLNEYTYNFSWLGRPIIQYPQDIIMMQEVIWETKPDLVIETGVAHGGSLILSASILKILGKGRVLGIDIDIRKHNLKKIREHPLSNIIDLIEGSSIAEETFDLVKKRVKKKNKVLVFLDSKHTHDHVLQELNLYSQFVSKNSYIVVFDTTANLFSKKTIKKISNNYRFKPWGYNNNPHSALKEFLKTNTDFVIEKTYQNKSLITNCYDGFLKKIK